MVREARLLVLVLSTISLKEAAAYGLRLADIVSLRLYASRQDSKADADGEEYQFDKDYDDFGSYLTPKLASFECVVPAICCYCHRKIR
ncbi:Hypothetical predicted protein [Olea europaea subsp. europaea]|uniref:Uncharacterized protein n=1 Tax=Olea europaea subsp. europaea TaxID=158383 RepID=A0A8S0RBS3_OLEEU|nr:Hypothetical predicted protein [Olea europaea subsp. europaea]